MIFPSLRVVANWSYASKNGFIIDRMYLYSTMGSYYDGLWTNLNLDLSWFMVHRLYWRDLMSETSICFKRVVFWSRISPIQSSMIFVYSSYSSFGSEFSDYKSISCWLETYNFFFCTYTNFFWITICWDWSTWVSRYSFIFSRAISTEGKSPVS